MIVMDLEFLPRSRREFDNPDRLMAVDGVNYYLPEAVM